MTPSSSLSVAVNSSGQAGPRPHVAPADPTRAGPRAERPRGPARGATAAAMACLGYRHRVVYLNSMHAAAISARARRSRGIACTWCFGATGTAPRTWTYAWPRSAGPATARSPRCSGGNARSTGGAGIASGTSTAGPPANWWSSPTPSEAATAIDWALLGQRIGDRATPLSVKTLARIRAGFVRYARVPPCGSPRGGRWDDAPPIPEVSPPGEGMPLPYSVESSSESSTSSGSSCASAASSPVRARAYL